jgi:dTDP-4-amino-4,6-dideoxygalactose transaminase
MRVPFLDLQAQHQPLQAELEAAAHRVLRGCAFVLGQEVADFERALAAQLGAAHAVAVHSGTAALHLSLLALDIGPGDEVITTPATFVATVAAILYVGAVPVLVDVDPVTHNLDPAKVREAITPRTRAVLPVHLHGLPADLAPLAELCHHHKLDLLEDAAQAIGATYQGQPLGALSRAAALSFYPSKNLGACGEGGAILTNDPALAHRLRRLRDWGQEEKGVHLEVGGNFRLDALQAALLAVKLPHLPRWTQARQAHAAAYAELLRGKGVGLPVCPEDRAHVYHVYAVQSAEREALRQRLTQAGIGTGLHYGVPVHRQPGYAARVAVRGSLEHAERFAAHTLSLPMYPELTPDHLAAVAASL